MARSILRSAALATAVAAATVLPAVMVGAAPAGAGSDRGQAARSEHQRIVEYWTPERMRAAIPRDVVRDPAGRFTVAPEPQGAIAEDGTSTGAGWIKGGQVAKRTGKVYFVMGRLGYVCSGATVADDGATGQSIVMTAGHCVYDGKKFSDRKPLAGFATNWLFIPDFGSEPTLNTRDCTKGGSLGCWTATALYAHANFVSQRQFTEQAAIHDYGFAVVGTGGRSRETRDLDATVGSYMVDTNLADGPVLGSTLSAFGYPAGAPYNGDDLTFCRGPLSTDPQNASAWGMPCDMTGGSSGGPWLADVDGDGNGGVLSSVNSYGYRNGADYMFGPKLGASAKAVYDAAILGAKGSAKSTIIG